MALLGPDVKSAKVTQILKLAEKAEEESHWSEAEGLFNDALTHCLNTDGPGAVAECYSLLAEFLSRRGRLQEGAQLQRMAEIFAKLEPPTKREDTPKRAASGD